MDFEAAADAVVGGDIAVLEALLHAHPELIRARSARAHRATLLHYVAANGVEDERQKSPANSAQVSELLLRAGAEVDALAETYGGGTRQTTLNLLVSSCHPARAGVQCALVEMLLDFGAAIEGVSRDGSPLMTALQFHYPDAAETLTKRGAKVDTLIKAAALGREDLVSKYFGDADSGDVAVAFVWAAMHRRRNVVEMMLQKGVDPGLRDQRGWTALHWTAYQAYPEIVRLLLDWRAPLDSENEFGGTPLGQTVWAMHHETCLPEHAGIVQMLGG